MVYLIDFGLSRRFMGADGSIRNVSLLFERNAHEKARTSAGFRGTARYASIQAHTSQVTHTYRGEIKFRNWAEGTICGLCSTF
jgi:hypothetical protein